MAERKRAVAQYLGGSSVEHLALEYGVSAQTIRSWAHAASRASKYDVKDSDAKGYSVPSWVKRWLTHERPNLVVIRGGVDRELAAESAAEAVEVFG